jgi:hypothetical protein
LLKCASSISVHNFVNFYFSKTCVLSEVCKEKVKKQDIREHISNHDKEDLRRMLLIAKKTSQKLHKGHKRKREYEKELSISRKKLKIVENAILGKPAPVPSSHTYQVTTGDFLFFISLFMLFSDDLSIFCFEFSLLNKDVFN